MSPRAKISTPTVRSMPFVPKSCCSAPPAGEAKPDAGIDARWQMAGFVGANGTNPLYEYTPRHAGSSGGSTIYGTLKLWIGDLSFVLWDALIESLSIVINAGGSSPSASGPPGKVSSVARH